MSLTTLTELYCWGHFLDKMLDLCSKTIEKAYYARESAFYKWVYYAAKLCGNIQGKC